MKKIFLFAAVIFLGFFILNQSLTAKKFKKPEAEKMLYNSAQGREFWIAIPPNEADGQPLGNTQPISVDIYVTSAYDTEVTLEVPNLGHIITKKVDAFKVTTFRTGDGETSFDWEIRKSDIITNKAIRLSADQPISVYVLSRRNVTSEGYLAIPISACGTEYMHLAYYDFFETIMGGDGEQRGAGFIIVAAEDNTKCYITLKGKGGAYPGGHTAGEIIHRIGESWEVTLQKGQTYAVFGTGKTRGVFDLSGSTVRSSKPVGFISFHKRTLIPSWDLWNGRDMLVEMLPPIDRWGKKYATVEYARNNHGDFFRLIASEDDTDWEVRWYNKIDGKFLKKQQGNLRKAGDFWEYLEVDCPRADNTFVSIEGTSVWEANKPILVMQYSYSADWDNASEFDPFMIIVCPVEQFIKGTVFQTPDGASGFNTNWFNIIATGDTNDLNQPDLKSIELDGEAIWNLSSQFIMNRIPTTNLYWAKIPVDPGAHHLTGNGNTSFGGYIYGFSQHDSYGWPAAMAFNVIGEVDTLPPVLTKVEECGNYVIRITELRNGKDGDKPKQVDRGIMSIELLEGSKNYDLELNDFIPWPTNYDWTIYVNVIDDTEDALGLLMVTDNEGNYTLDTLIYAADSLTLDPEIIDYGLVRLNTTKEMLAVLTNETEVDVEVLEIKLFDNSVYQILSGGVPPEFTMAPGDTHHVWIAYTPTKEPLTSDDKDIDSLIVNTLCSGFVWPITGQGGIPRIVVQDWDAGAVKVGETVCLKELTGRGLRVQNTGSETLIITDIINMAAPFNLTDPYTPMPEFSILPGEEVFIEDVCFTPDDTLVYEIDVEFICNANGPDNIANLKGRGIIPGPNITNKDWQERRVKTINDSMVVIGNNGNTPIRLNSVALGTNNLDFEIIGTDPSLPTLVHPKFSDDEPKQVKVFVRFTPQSEGIFHDTVIPEFDDIEPGSVVGTLDGIGILPKIEVQGFKWETPVLIGETASEIGYVTIKSTSETADLWVESIEFVNANQNDFFPQATIPQQFLLLRGESVEIPVKFTPAGVYDRVEKVRVMSDAVEGPEPIYYVPSDTLLEGYCYSIGIEVTNLDYHMVLLCDDPQGYITIMNTSISDDAIVDSLVFVEGDKEVFEILTQFPQTIPFNDGTINVDVIFHPTEVKYYSAKYRVYTTMGNDYYTLFEGTGYNVPVEFHLKKWTSSEQQNYSGQEFIPGEVIPLPVSIECNNYLDAEITNFSIEIIYDKDWLRYADNIKKSSGLDNTWTIDAIESVIDDDNNKLTITGQGTSPINKNAVLVDPFFMILLTDTDVGAFRSSFEPWFGEISLGTRDECLVITNTPGYVSSASCVRDLRNIVPSDVNFSLSKIEPNPVTTSFVSLEFAIGFDCNTLIEIYNSNGDLVRTLVNNVKDKGYYTLNFDVRNLSSGVYHIRINSGPYQETQKLVITR